ncbi:MAG TPA: CHAT domain-containing protein [Thermoanaerobaculia bacterium]
MPTEAEALAEIRSLGSKGAYAEAAQYAATLAPEIRSRPAVALQIARNFLRQGHPIHAEQALAAAVLDDATTGERLILAMEAASLRVYRTVAIRDALDRASAALAAAETASIDAADRAEAERVHIRILLTAATYREVPGDVAAAAQARLLHVAQELDRAGRIDEALAARFTHAERQDDVQGRIAALERFAVTAIDAGRPALAAEAHTLRADMLLGSGGASGEIRALLASAEELYARAGHRHGPIDVARVRARLAVDRELAGLDGLEACVDAYRRVGLHRGVMVTLMDLSPLAHVRGNTAAAAIYRREAMELAEAVGMELSRDTFRMGQIDLLMRSQRYGEAKELAEAALASDLPRWMHAGYELLLGSIYSFLDDVQSASVHGRRALELYDSVGDSDSASDGVQKLASDLSSRGTDAAFDEAESLLAQWTAYDDRRKNAAGSMAKREMRAQLDLLRYRNSAARRGDPALLDRADAALLEAEALAPQLSPREGAQRLGSLQQMRSQVLQTRGDEDGSIAALQAAIAHYDRGGFAMESANCHYLIGVFHLNRSLVDLLANFGVAEEQLRTALAYYDAAGMRGQAADTRYMFALLYRNTAPRVPPDLGAQMLDAALGHLRDAETDADAIRREFDAGGSAVGTQAVKYALAARTRRAGGLAMEILCRIRPDAAEAWRHAQRMKARALVDLLGMSAVPPVRIVAEIESHADAKQLLAHERELAGRVHQAPPDQRPEIREELRRTREQMAGDPRFAEYLELRTGDAVDEADVPRMFGDERCVCVDWVAAGDQLFLLTRRAGEAPQQTLLAAGLRAVQAFVQTNLRADAFRVNLHRTPEVLDELDPLVAPLRDLTSRGELLIFSPTGPLHALPLHALHVDGDALIARNPIVYTPSLTVLRHCLSRAIESVAGPSAALFGDPTGDRADAAELVAYLEERFATKALLGSVITRAAFCQEVAGRRLVHFQGHATHDPAEPLQSYLALSDGRFTARDVFALEGLRADLVTLAACESASMAIAAGDEPLGLIPAFLYAGAASVLATLWKVHQRSAAHLMRLFYDARSAGPSADKARILQASVLELRDSGFSTPYHWAPFVLHGAWR